VRTTHHPEIARRPDGHWVVTCRECVGDRDSTVPIGINMPIRSRHLAEMLCANHAGRRSAGHVHRPGSSIGTGAKPSH
jgi:hypothetical protein